MSFWLWATLLLVAAVAFVVWPLLRVRAVRGREVPESGNAATVRALYQERLTELDAEVAVGQLAPESRDAVAAELGAALLADYADYAEDPVAAAPKTDAPRRGLAAAAAGLLVVVGVGLYLQVGEPNAHRLRGAEALLSLNPETQAEALADWRARLEARVDAKPDDAPSWYLLGHARLLLRSYPEAAEAFANAHALVGEDPNVDVYWLQARYLAARGMIDATSRAIANRLLASRPNHPVVLEMFAIDAYRRGDLPAAVGFLDRALAGPLGLDQRASLSRSLDQVRAELGHLTPSLDLRVAAAGAPPAGATLFVIARPVGGGMPFAVVRRPDARLPMTVRLDDAVAMNPERPLSTAEQVQLVVRLSPSGQATAQPGDWEWRSEAVGLAGLTDPLSFDVELVAPSKES